MGDSAHRFQFTNTHAIDFSPVRRYSRVSETVFKFTVRFAGSVSPGSIGVSLPGICVRG
jgi:hypothetical protein